MAIQLELNQKRLDLLDKLRQAVPDFMPSEKNMNDKAYADGALSGKVKRLIALGIALRAGCTNCILAQTMNALEAGATREEILETCIVEVAMSGTTGIAESLRVVELLDELGKLG